MCVFTCDIEARDLNVIASLEGPEVVGVAIWRLQYFSGCFWWYYGIFIVASSTLVQIIKLLLL